MHKASTALLVALLFSSLSLWGCSHQKNGANHTKIRELENRYVKLEEDYRVVVALSDANRKKVAQLESQRSELAQKVEELEAVVLERDNLKKQLASRTQERDTVHSQLVQFSKDLQAFASRIENVANSSPGALTVAVPASRKTN